MKMTDKLFQECVDRQEAKIYESQEKIRTANRLRLSFEGLRNLTDNEIRLENLMANPATCYDTSSINIDNRFYTEQFGVHMYQIWRYAEKMYRENGVNIFEGIDMVKVKEGVGPDVSPGFLKDIVNDRKMNEELYNRLKQISEEILNFEQENKDRIRAKRKKGLIGLANENLYSGLGK